MTLFDMVRFVRLNDGRCQFYLPHENDRMILATLGYKLTPLASEVPHMYTVSL